MEGQRSCDGKGRTARLKGGTPRVCGHQGSRRHIQWRKGKKRSAGLGGQWLSTGQERAAGAGSWRPSKQGVEKFDFIFRVAGSTWTVLSNRMM